MRKYLTVIALALVLCAPAVRAQELERHWSEAFARIRPLYGIPDTASILFIGDVMMHKRQLSYDCTRFLEGIRRRLNDADLAVANMEFTLAGPPYTGYPAFSAPDAYARYAADCGIDVFLTANNHILDKGKAGLERTMAQYRSLEEEGRIRFTGTAENARADSASYPLIVRVRGIRVALVNFTYGTNTDIPSRWPKVNRMEKDDIRAAVRRARERGAEFIIALPHWGEEYRLVHSLEQEQMARFLVEEGVDAIIGAHPHVVQDAAVLEAYPADGGEARSVPVFFSLGNAVSNMSARNTRLELAVTLRFARDRSGNVRLLPPEAEYLWCTLPGTLTEGYMTIAVGDYLGQRERWTDPSDYDNMAETLERVSQATGIRYKAAK